MAMQSPPPFITPEVAARLQEKVADVGPSTQRSIDEKLGAILAGGGAPPVRLGSAVERIGLPGMRMGIPGAPRPAAHVLHSLVFPSAAAAPAVRRGPLSPPEAAQVCYDRAVAQGNARTARQAEAAAKKAQAAATKAAQPHKISYTDAVTLLLGANAQLPAHLQFRPGVDFGLGAHGRGLSRRAHELLAANRYELKGSSKKGAKKAKKSAKKAKKSAKKAKKSSKRGKKAKKSAKKDKVVTVSHTEALRKLGKGSGATLTQDDREALACRGIHVSPKRRTGKKKSSKRGKRSKK